MSAVLEAPRVTQTPATQDTPTRFSYRAFGITFQDSAFVPIGYPTIVPRDFVPVYQHVANKLTDSKNAFLRIFEAEEPAKAVGRPINPEREAVIIYAGNRNDIPVFLGAINRVLDEVTARDMREDPKGTEQILAKNLMYLLKMVPTQLQRQSLIVYGIGSTFGLKLFPYARYHRRHNEVPQQALPKS